ncbi:MAG: ribosome maturation factor RimM [Clostridiales bacterium]|nr:ribosome maturation factor RimM [Clostridiales bacterium]
MENFLEIGIIVKPQGVRGELKVKPFTDAAEDFLGFKRVFLKGEEYRVLSCRTGAGIVYLGLRGVPDRNAAELLRGVSVCVPREEMPETEEGTYYVADLLEASIVTEEGEALGTLTDIRQAATDVYTLTAGDKEILFPVADGVIVSVDVEQKIITVNKKRFYEVAVV